MKKFAVLSVLLLSVAAQVNADDVLSNAFKACLNRNAGIVDGSANADGSLNKKAVVAASKVGVDGTSNSLVELSCSYSEAEALFQAAGRYSTETQKRWSDGSVVISRTFGRLSVGSQCNRKIRDSDGNEANQYWCNIIIDLVPDFTKALNL